MVGFIILALQAVNVNIIFKEVNNRIIVVGESERASRLASLLENVNRISSSRGFITYSGLYKTVPISVVFIGMGLAMMDFFVREARVIIEGPMFILRNILADF